MAHYGGEGRLSAQPSATPTEVIGRASRGRGGGPYESGVVVAERGFLLSTAGPTSDIVLTQDLRDASL